MEFGFKHVDFEISITHMSEDVLQAVNHSDLEFRTEV